MNSKISQILQSSIDVKTAILQDKMLLQLVEDLTHLIAKTFQNGGQVFFCGNGGSAADAQHLAAEFSGRFYKSRKPLPSEALHCNTSYLTAVGNDYGFEFIYSRLIEGMGRENDILIGLSTSGNSANILEAIKKANELNLVTVGMTGADGGKLKDLARYNIAVPSKETPRIQEAHITIGHIICELVEELLFE